MRTSLLASIGILLAFMVIIVLLLNPFNTIPSIKVGRAYWVLGREGYILYLNISTTAPVQLLGIDVDGRYIEVAYDIEPPSTSIKVPTRVKGREVKLHFNIGSPLAIRPVDMSPDESSLNITYSNEWLLLYGVLISDGIVAVIPVSSETRLLVVVPPGMEDSVKRYIMRRLPGFTGTILDARRLNKSLLEEYTTIVFTDITPSPELLEEITSKDKVVILHVWSRNLGELRIEFSGNTTVVINRYDPGKSDIDYFGAHCTIGKRGYGRIVKVNYIAKLIDLYGYPRISYAIIPSEYCRRQFTEVHIEAEGGYIVAGYTKKKFYYTGIELKHVLLLAMSGFFEGIEKDILTLKISPFKGIKPVTRVTEHTYYLVTVLTRDLVTSFFTGKPPITYDVSGDKVTLTLGISSDGRVIWKGIARIRVEEYSYDMELLDVEYDNIVALPTNIVLDSSPLHVYVVYVNDTLVAMIIDEFVLREKPSVSIEYSSICELFSLTIRRLDDLPSPLILTVNGKNVFVLTSDKRVYEVYECKPGYHDVVVKDVYGNIIRRVRFKVMHIYETPSFVLTILSGISVLATLYLAMKKRIEKEVEEIRLVLYKLPEVEEKTINEYVVAEVVNSIISSKKRAPRVDEILNHIYRKHPTLKSIADATVCLATLMDKKKAMKIAGTQYKVYSRYVPELDDTITLVVRKDLDPMREFYNQVITELLKRFGGVCEVDEIREIMDVDLVAVLGNKMLLITYAPMRRFVKDALDRGLSTFIRVRRFKLPFKLVGVAVVTEPKYVESINKIIDSILEHNEEIANKVFRNMTVFTQLRAVPREEWLRHYIIVAVPITRIAPLFAFAKKGAVRLCNKYYRLTYFTTT